MHQSERPVAFASSSEAFAFLQEENNRAPVASEPNLCRFFDFFAPRGTRKRGGGSLRLSRIVKVGARVSAQPKSSQ